MRTIHINTVNEVPMTDSRKGSIASVSRFKLANRSSGALGISLMGRLYLVLRVSI